MAEAHTISAKYVFLDIVSFTRDRSIEAQSDLVAALNNIVAESVSQQNLKEHELIFLPTGDGMCICLLNADCPYDCHLSLALDIVNRVDEWNEKIDDSMRQFKVRIGLSANVDNLVTDINGKKNLAGAGINSAQRVMSAADGNQVLAGQLVFETLNQREKYMGQFRSYSLTAKHGLRIPVHQFIQPGHRGLNVDTPTAFIPKAPTEVKLSTMAAYYFAHAHRLRPFLLGKRDSSLAADGATILLWMMARDSVARAETTELSTPCIKLWKAGAATVEQQFSHYLETDMWVGDQFTDFVEGIFSEYSRCFAEVPLFRIHFLSLEGEQKLKEERPKIWEEFGFDRGSEPPA